MIRPILSLLTIVFVCFSNACIFANPYTENDVMFIPNHGQIHDGFGNVNKNIFFIGKNQSSQIFAHATGYAHQIMQQNHIFAGLGPCEKSVQLNINRVDIAWLDALPMPTPVAGKALGSYNNYYNMPQQPQGITGVPEYSDYYIKNIYYGIDIRFYQNNQSLEYDYVLVAGADYRQIKLAIKGCTPYLNAQGDLVLPMPLGNIVETAPKVFQAGKLLPSKWKKNADGTWGFEIGAFNPSLAMVIDPVVRMWGTYVGGNNFDEGFGCAASKAGTQVYMAGQTLSANQIASAGAFQNSLAGNVDAFVSAFQQSGPRVWSTYFGGSLWDQGIALRVDQAENIILAGNTQSTANIATNNVYQNIHRGNWEVFVAKFNSTGVRLWASYFGGNSWDQVKGVSIDNNNAILICGETLSNSHIASASAHQVTGGGAFDAFLAKFNLNGQLQWATYYGGSGEDYGTSCITDQQNNVYLAGYTGSNSQIASNQAFQRQLSLDPIEPFLSTDAFLVRFNTNGVRQWGTYFGGRRRDRAWGVTTDSLSNIYLVGETLSDSGIATTGVHQNTYAGSLDGFVAKVGQNGQLQWATYIGGSGSDSAMACVADGNEGVFVAGRTTSTNGIATPGAFQNNNQGFADGFLMKISPNGQREDATYYGSTGNEYITAIDLGLRRTVFVTGTTPSTTRIATNTGFQSNYGGGPTDAFLARFELTSSVGLLPQETPMLQPLLMGNPFSDYTQLWLPDNMIGAQVQLFDLKGKQLWQVQAWSNLLSLGSNLPNGIYLLSISTALNNKTFKVVKYSD